MKFLPDAGYGPSSMGYFTSCFLVLPSEPVTNAMSHRGTQHPNQTFLHPDIHLAFHQKVDLRNLEITPKETSSFSRALRVLLLEPSFHLTELETSVASSTGDDALSEISDGQLVGWSPASSMSIKKKKQELETYLDRKRKGKLLVTSRPPGVQLMVMQRWGGSSGHSLC